ncbi:MAG TPA: hypothetical protein VJB90_06195 [Candidatus Nanoarchaeia archaeon]|nr:hypothetical protein [Candidatus Nanoarchaeia archaeon]
MEIGKKGVIFSFMALLAIGLVLFILIPQQSELNLERTNIIRTRVQIADDYVKAVHESYLPGMVYVTSYKTLTALAIYVGNGSFFQNKGNFTEIFKEVLLNGTIKGVNVNTKTKAGIFDKNLTGMLRDLQNISNSSMIIETNFNFDYNSTKVDIFQANETLGQTMGPWQVAVNVTFNYSIITEAARWNRTDSIVVIFSIEGLPDPLYLGSTKGNFSNIIVKTNLSNFTLSDFQTFVNKSQYVYEAKSTSYLRRFYNDTSLPSDDCCGIESFVRDEVDNYFKPWPKGEINESFVDCNFFGGRCVKDDLSVPLASYYINGITNNTYRFKIDQYRAFAKYNIPNCAPDSPGGMSGTCN